jgi:hypothetical protein
VQPSARRSSPFCSRTGFSPTSLTPNGSSHYPRCSGHTFFSIESFWESSHSRPAELRSPIVVQRGSSFFV